MNRKEAAPKILLVVGKGWNQTYELDSHAITGDTLVCYVSGDFPGVTQGQSVNNQTPSLKEKA